MTRRALWRYVVPNLVTATSLSFAILSILSSLEGHVLRAAWFGLYCVLTDKADGFAARLLGGSSEFGVQFDSLADFLSFGIAPAILFYSFLAREPQLGFTEGPWRVALQGATIGYILFAAFRLA